MVSDLRVSSTQYGLSIKSHSSFTPKFCSLLWLSSSSLRWEGLDFRAEVSKAEPSCVILHCDMLQKEHDIQKPLLMFKQRSTERRKDMFYLRISSLQCGLSSPVDSIFTPLSWTEFLLKSSSFRWEPLDFRSEAKEAQLVSDNLQ